MLVCYNFWFPLVFVGLTSMPLWGLWMIWKIQISKFPVVFLLIGFGLCLPILSKLVITLALLLGGAVLVCRSATTLFSRLVNSDRLGILPTRRTLSLAPWWTLWLFTTGRWFYTYICIYMTAWFPTNCHVLVISLVGLVAFICASVALLRLNKGNPVLLYGIHLER